MRGRIETKEGYNGDSSAFCRISSISVAIAETEASERVRTSAVLREEEGGTSYLPSSPPRARTATPS